MANEIDINNVSDAAYDATAWDGVTSIAPSKNAIRDKIAALEATTVQTNDTTLCVLDFGITTGTATTQTSAISAAFAANPGRAFYFPPGDYRLDTTLAVTTNNWMILDPDARIYAGAAMDILINYDNGLTAAASYAADKGLLGGTIDCALLANKAIRIASVLRFTLERLTIINPVNRGIVLGALGAEVTGRNIRIHNTGTTNVADNIAIEADMGDCTFSDVIIRDFTTGVWDKGGNTWNDIHPWIGTTAQLTARYPTSVAFILASKSILHKPYADTYRYSFRSAAASGYAMTRVSEPRFYCNTGNLTSGLQSANPGAVFDLVDGGQMQVSGGRYSGGSDTPFAFVQGSSIRFNARNMIDEVPGSVTGLLEYRRGVQTALTSFAASVFGSTSGSATLSTNSCQMEVRDGVVEWRFILVGTIPASGWAGALRIGLPAFPAGATSTSTAMGFLAYITSSVSPTTFNNVSTVIASALTSPGITVCKLNTVGTGNSVEPETTAIAGATIQIWGQLTASFTYPS